MDRLHGLTRAVQQSIGKETVPEARIQENLKTVFSDTFLAQVMTEGEFHKARTLARSTPWKVEIERLLGADND